MLRAGDFVERYKIERRLGLGGMGTLYLAHDPVLDRQIALKFLLGDIDLPDTRDRFVREAQTAAALSHPNIVTIYDYGDYQSQPYIVMEYIHGETLAELIRRRAEVAVPHKLRWVEELCTAVGYAHAREIIHRDIKPLNLMIDGYGRLKVLDFGIARMRGTLASHATALIGTPGYCAPEQIKGGEVDLRSDLFSIAVVCYELLGYKEAFGNDSVPAITNRVLSEAPTALSQLNPEIDADLEAVVMRALEKPADARFQSAEAFREAIAGVRARLESETDATTTRYVSPLEPSRRSASGAAAAGAATAWTPREGAMPDAVGGAVATPPPDSRRTDREHAARLRVAQVREHVRAAQAHLDAHELLEAEAACHVALRLDDAHPEALAILAEVEIDREHAVAEYLGQARDSLGRRDTGVVKNLLEQIQELDPGNDEAAELNRELRVLRADLERSRRRKQTFDKCIEMAEAALARGAHDEALDHAREALEIEPTSPQALRLQEAALGDGDRTVVRQTPRRVTAPLSGATPGRRSLSGASETARPTPRGSASGTSETVLVTPRGSGSGARPTAAPAAKPKPTPKPPAIDFALLARRWQALPVSTRWAIAVVPALVVAVALAVALWPKPVPPAPQVVVVDAAPWGLVTSLQDESGAAVTLPADRHTPFTMMLPPGRYRVVLQGPPPASQSQSVDLQIELAKPARVFAAFNPPSADEYFAPYLVPPAPPADAPPASGTQPASKP